MANEILSRKTYGFKQVLRENQVFYLRPDGSDSDSGLVDSAQGAWLTLNGAWQNISRNYDSAGFIITLSLGDGTYAPLANYGMAGTGGSVHITSTSGDADDVIIETVSNYGTCINHYCIHPTPVYLTDVTLKGGAGFTNYGAAVYNAGNLLFVGLTPALASRTIKVTGNFDIVFAAAAHTEMTVGGTFKTDSLTWNRMLNCSKFGFGQIFLDVFEINANLTVGYATVTVALGSAVWYAPALTGSGTPSFVKKFEAIENGVISSYTTIPGTAVGTTASGGVAV